MSETDELEIHQVTVVFKTELDWMTVRYDARDNGYVIRGHSKYEPLFLDFDQLPAGVDLWRKISGDWTEELAIERWFREEIAGSVTSEIKSAKWEASSLVITNFGNWLENERNPENFDQNNGGREGEGGAET
jgi:hypothetical protein